MVLKSSSPSSATQGSEEIKKIEKCTSKNNRKTRCKSFSKEYHSYDNFEKFELFYEAKHLRTFLPFFEGISWSYSRSSMKIPNELWQKLRYLRVLSLSDCHIKKLKHLRYLDLSSTLIESLPNTICTLFNLQTLLLLHCYCLTELPANTGTLINLRHLNNTETKLSCHHLGNYLLKELHIIGMKSVVAVGPEFYGNFSFRIQSFQCLEILWFLDMEQWQEWFFPDGEHGNGVFLRLRELYIMRCDNLEGEIPFYPSLLKKLVIDECLKFGSSLQTTPAMCEFQISCCYKFLTDLTISWSLKSFPFDLFPNLRYLVLSSCRKLESFNIFEE